jgi:hypothetical protein
VEKSAVLNKKTSVPLHIYTLFCPNMPVCVCFGGFLCGSGAAKNALLWAGIGSNRYLGGAAELHWLIPETSQVRTH